MKHNHGKTYLADCPVCIHGFTSEVDLRRHLLEHVLNCESKTRHGPSDVHIDLSTSYMPYRGTTSPANNPYKVLQSILWPKRGTGKRVVKHATRARAVRRRKPYKKPMLSGPRKRKRVASQRLRYESPPPGSDGDDWAPDTGYDDYQDALSDTAAQQYRCSVCKSVFSDRESCQTHILTHIEESTGPGIAATGGARTKLYRCSVCAMLFNDRAVCEKHIAVHSTTAVHTIAQGEQPTPVSLVKASEPENAAGDKKSGLYRCGICRAIFDDKLSCEQHAQTHSATPTTSQPSASPLNKPADDKLILSETQELHRCSVCKKIFNDKISCEKHMESHALRPSDTPQLKSGAGLLREILTRTSDQVKITTQTLYRCSVCKEIFKDVASCERHTATHHLKPMKCVLCEKDCGSKADLMLHMNTIHPQVKFIQQEGAAEKSAGGDVDLDADTRTGMTRTEMQDTHNRMMAAEANNEQPVYEEVTDVRLKSNLIEDNDEIAPGAAEGDVLMADESGEEFADAEIVYVDSEKKPTIKNHVQVVYAQVEESIECSICGKCLKTKRALGEHIKSHPTCDECGDRFRNKDLLFKHLRESHKAECEVCGNVYNSQSRLSQHMKSHTGVEWPPKCQECGQVFDKERELTRHMVIKHTKDYPHLCDQCGTGFVDKSKLVRHMQKHLQEKKHQCTECGKRFNDKGVMKRHFLIHTGEKPYICHRCGKAFREQTTLRNHLKRPACTSTRTLAGEEWKKAHSQEPVVCHICGQLCKSKRSLAVHVQKHSGVKPQVFPCEVCLDAFLTRGALTTHQRTCTPLVPGHI